jgi:hypothetical protein
MVNGTTTLVSVNTSGATGNGNSDKFHFTPDCRYVVFQSDATDLVPNDSNGSTDVFVRDLVNGTTTLVSVNSAGTGPGNAGSDNATITPDGRYVVFESSATNLVANDTTGGINVFVRDLVAGTTTLVSVNQAGTGPGNSSAQDASISDDGRYVAFDSSASNLVNGDDNGASDVFVRDLVAGTTTLVSVNSAGTGSGNGASQYPALSGDGRHVVFQSAAGNLTSGSGPTSTYENVYLRDLTTGTTVLLDQHAVKYGYVMDQEYALSGDGQHVALGAAGDDLTPGDYNSYQDVYIWSAPMGANPGGPYFVPEGSSVTLDGSASTDSNSTIVSYEWDYHYNGTSFTVDATGVKPTFSAASVDGPQTLTIALRITDQLGMQSIATTTVSITNPAPTATLSNNGPITAGNAVTVSFSNASGSPDDTQAGFHYSIALAAANLAGSYASAGTSASPQITINTAGSNTVFGRILDDDGGFTDYTTTVTVNPAAAAKYLISAALTTIAGNSLAFSVTAQDQFGNTATGYGGTLSFTSSDAKAALPANYSFIAADQGVHSFTATLKTAGTQSLTATDTNTASITGTQTGIVVSPAAISAFGVAGYPSPAVAGVSQNFTVTALDAYGNTVTGYTGMVHFTSSDPQAIRPAEYTFTTSDAGVHTFSATLKTAGSQSITTTDPTANVSGSQTGILINPASVSSLTVTSYPSPTTAGQSQNFTVTALDPYGNKATGFVDTVHFTSSDGQAILPADYTFTSSDAGVHVFSATLKTAGAQSITAKDTSNPASVSGTQSGISVSPAATAVFVLTGFPSPTTAGVSQSFTVTAEDSYGNTTTGYIGKVHVTSSDHQAALPADYTFTATDAGVYAFTATLKTAGAQSIMATDTTTASITGSQTGISVNAAAAKALVVSGYASPTTAGVSQNFSVTARDAYGNTATGYTGKVHFTSSDGQAALPADYTFAATDAGIHTFSAALKTAGTQSITATDTTTASISGSQTGISVKAAAASVFVVVGFPSPTTAGIAHTFTVTAKDAYGNVAIGYAGTVHFSSTDKQAALPADYTFTAADAGVHSFSATLKTAGSQSITATDTKTASLTGSQTGISVVAAAAFRLLIAAPASASAGKSFTITVSVVDAYGNVVTGYRGTIHFASSDHRGILPADYTFTGADNGVHSFAVTFKSRGNQSLTATDTKTSSIKGSASVTVT